MMWDYVMLADETQIALSEIQEDGTVVVAVERPADMGFDSARCVLPAMKWSDIEGFSQEEIDSLDMLVRDNAPFIFELSQRHTDEQAVA